MVICYIVIIFSLTLIGWAYLCENVGTGRYLPWHWFQTVFCPNDSVQFSLFAQWCPTLCNPTNRSMPGLPVHHQLPEFTQTHVHWVGYAIQPSHSLSSPFPPAPNPSQHPGLFQWVSSSHEVAKVLESQLLHQSLQWTPRTVSPLEWTGWISLQSKGPTHF